MTKALFLRFILAVQVSVLLLLCLIFLTQVDLPVSDDEGLSLWVVEDSAPMWNIAPRDSLRGVRANVSTMLDRVEETNTPPLYYAVLDGWVMLFGDSLLAVRMLTVLCVALALPAIVHIMRRYMPTFPITPAFAIALLLSLPILLIVNFYGLLLFFASASLWFLLRWQKYQRMYQAIFYVIFLTCALLTAHVAIPLLILHGVIAWRDGMLRRWLICAAISLAFLIFPPENIGVFITPSGIETAFVATMVIALPVLAVLPAINIKSYGLYVNFTLTIFVIGGALLLWRDPNWREEINAVNELREPTDPAIMAIDPRSALGYFDRQSDTQLSKGISVNVGWRHFSDEELDAILMDMQNAPAIWVFLPQDRPETAYIFDHLAETRSAGYDATMGDMIFRRYDSVENDAG